MEKENPGRETGALQTGSPTTGNGLTAGVTAEGTADSTNVGLRIPVTKRTGVKLPVYVSAGSVGADLCAFLEKPVTLQPGDRFLFPTGLRLQIPDGYEGQVRPRSGLAVKHGVTVLNAPGTIDSDYRGEIKIVLINLGREAYTVEPDERIAQLLIAPVIRADFELSDSLDTSGRGENGFGSTGA
ncbi:MAG: dUTP diphosphatase [Spirochaetales bacterium]|nr:dUTP diphosphatase [Spirochaetales bacterium]